MQVIFARIPTSEMQIIPPKCFGEPATIAALEDTVQQYTWNFYGGLVDSISPANVSGGLFEHFIYWNDEDTVHRVSMIATNFWGCQSPINIDTVQEPPIPIFDVTMVLDTCALGKGGIVFAPTIENSFFWIDPNYGPTPGDPITEVYNLPAGEYGIRVSYLTPNIVNYSYYINTFGTANCIDTMIYEIETIGMIDAEMSISADIVLEDLVAPNATVIFLNTSDYDDVSKRCEWHFDDGTIVKNCDELIEHIYTEAGCYEPFLIVMNRDLPECRDTARLETCVFVDNASKLEVPNVFSPNADGINDFFQVKAQTLRTFSGVIVNRWGRTVFEWTNWEDYEAGWDGKLSGGTDASPGVYYYVITAEGMDDAPYEIQGALHLMRE
jgi:gliding motility-associated-like protein